MWENQPTTLGKSATDFGKMSHRLWENGPLTLGSCVLEEKQALFFGKKTSPSLAQSLGKLVRFLDWLGTKLKSHCFERLACLDLDLGIQNCVSLKCSNLYTLISKLFWGCVRHFCEMTHTQTDMHSSYGGKEQHLNKY